MIPIVVFAMFCLLLVNNILFHTHSMLMCHLSVFYKTLLFTNMTHLTFTMTICPSIDRSVINNYNAVSGNGFIFYIIAPTEA